MGVPVGFGCVRVLSMRESPVEVIRIKTHEPREVFREIGERRCDFVTVRLALSDAHEKGRTMEGTMDRPSSVPEGVRSARRLRALDTEVAGRESLGAVAAVPVSECLIGRLVRPIERNLRARPRKNRPLRRRARR